MQCKKCGTEIRDGCLFCHNCGEAVQMVPDYEPELEELEIKIAKKQTEKPVNKVEPKPDDVKKGEKNEQQKKSHWKMTVLVISVILGIAAFALAYSSVLESQNPDAMQQPEPEKEEEEIVYISKPEFQLPGGEYSYYISVKLTSSVKGTIYYTLDGSSPNEASFRYEEPICLEEGTTVIRAFVMDEDGNSSEIASEVYEIEFGAPDPPTIFPESGDYIGENYVRILVPEGCVAYYTLDGSDPTKAAEIYTGEFLMPEGTTIVQAMLEDENGVLSDVSSVLYTCGYMIE